MDVKFINPFVNSVINTLATMAGKTPVRLAPSLKQDNCAKGDISGIIGFAGKSVHGSVALSFPQETALKIYSLMVGDASTKINNDVQDTVGELANIVAGSAKTEFDKQGMDFHISIPTVVVGKNHTIIHKGNTPVVLIPFKLESCEFVMEISIKTEGSLNKPPHPAKSAAMA
jgi:chemotaxis protein CheX